MEDEKGSLLHVFYGSILSSIVSRIILYPLDTIKTNRQVDTFKNFSRGKRTTLQNRFYFLFFLNKFGYKQLYKGFLFSLITTIPATSLYFCSFEYLKLKAISLKKKYLAKNEYSVKQIANPLNSFNFFCLGYLTEAIACILFVPVDVVKEKMQTQALLGLYRYKNSLPLIKDIVYKAGIRRLYKGFNSTLLSFGFFSALFFCFQNVGENWMKKNNVESSALTNFQLNILSSFGASLITTPLETVKTRFQVQEKNRTMFYYSSTIDGLEKLWKEGGIIAFYKGSMYRCLLLCLNVSLNMTIINTVKNTLSSKSYDQKQKN